MKRKSYITDKFFDESDEEVSNIKVEKKKLRKNGCISDESLSSGQENDSDSSHTDCNEAVSDTDCSEAVNDFSQSESFVNKDCDDDGKQKKVEFGDKEILNDDESDEELDEITLNEIINS